MLKRCITPVTYLVAIVFFSIGLYSKIAGFSQPLVLFLACFVSQAVFSTVSIMEVNRSVHLSGTEKRNWRLYLFFAPLVFGLPYFSRLRKRALAV